MIRLRQLLALRTVLASRTMTAAAESFGVTQPAMSRLIAQLEDEVGFRVLRRERGRIALTDEGARFWREAERVLDAMRELKTVADELRQRSESRIKILSLPGLINSLIARPVAAFSAQRPTVRISIEVLNRGPIDRVLDKQQFDIALVTGPIAAPPDVDAQSIAVLPAICILPARHPLAGKAAITPADLAGVPFVSFPPGSALRKRVDAVFAEHGVERALRYESHSAEIVCEMVAAGMGVSVITPISPTPEQYGAVARPFEPQIAVEYLMLRPGAARRAPQADQLARMIASEAAAIGDAPRGGSALPASIPSK